MDSGADGIVPMVNIQEEVQQLIYGEVSTIGYADFGISRGQGYGFDFHDYEAWNESSTLIIQIESIQGVENIETAVYPDVDE